MKTAEVLEDKMKEHLGEVSRDNQAGQRPRHFMPVILNDNGTSYLP
jgi:hypothetical protein